MILTIPIPSAARVSAVSLQSLPPELKLMIMLRLHNKSSLRNINRTSATFRGLYRSKDEAIYTAITIRSLAQRGFDVFSQVNALKFYVLKHTWSDSDIAGAVRILYTICQQHEANHSRDTIVRCPVQVCTVALHILHAVAYDLPNFKSVGVARAIQRFQYRNMREWSAMRFPFDYPYGYWNYRVIEVNKGS